MFDGLTIDSIAARAVLVPMPRPLRTAGPASVSSGTKKVCIPVTSAPPPPDRRQRRRVAEEWFSTGDIGRVDVDGYFFLVARRSI
jgi:acyl-CoA synthetase (AMP-forming)/AMP-acid ligase II